MKGKKIVILFIISILIFIFCVWQNNDIVTSNYIYKTAKISDALNGYKIAQISDLHNKEFGKNNKNLLGILEEGEPDIIVITGDVVDDSRTDIEAALEFVKGAVEIAPVYYVTGNQEYWLSRDDWDKLMQGMEERGVTLLDNETVSIETENNESFYLIGLGDKSLSNNTLATLCAGLDPQKLQILLAHEPQYIEKYSKAGVDFVFAGHAHGGQFRLPFVGGFFAPDQGFFPKYTAGTYLINNTTMVVSRGLGNSKIPVRIFNRPDVAIVVLQKR